MNKKGFTLIEIIVSVGLLALIGVAVGISLNKTFKNQEKMNYQEYVDKVKSAALLYANNTTQITNELNSNASFKILKVEELINNGYINKSLENPKTKEKVNKNDEIRIYYNENNEMMVEYPYTKKDEIYLYAMNYSTTYQNQESNLCYKGKNTSILQIVTFDGEGAGIELKPNENIKAYMEDGSLCYDTTTNKSKIDTSKIGTYKIRYEYTTDGKSLEESENKKTAERTITIKPSKPVIKEFNVTSKYENECSYNALVTYDISDVEGNDLFYCLGITDNIRDCDNRWQTVENKKISADNPLNINLKELFTDIDNYPKVDITLFVKNEFEESTSMKMKDVTYWVKGSVILDATFGYFNEADKPKVKVIENLYNHENPMTIKDFFNTSLYVAPLRDKHKLLGWGISSKDRLIEYTENQEQLLTGKEFTMYAKWNDITPPTCTVTKSNLNTTAGVNAIVECFDEESGCVQTEPQSFTGLKSSKKVKLSDNEGNVYNCEIKVISECTKSHQECETYTKGPKQCNCEEHSGVERCDECYWTEEVCNKVCDRYIYK